jgi:hypothetical protein
MRTIRPPYIEDDIAQYSSALAEFMSRAMSRMASVGWPHRLTMSKAIPKECMALLKEASEMFSETGCVPGIDGEEVPAETMVPDAKEYISETIDDPEAIYDPEIWDTSGFALVLSWLAQKWNQRCRKLAPLGSKNPGQYLTKEQQKACLEMAAAELIREITQGRSLN